VGRGQTETFTATVAGTNSPPQAVAWTVEGGSSGTSITSRGVLTVGAEETASSLTVRAVSTYDTRKSGLATVIAAGDDDNNDSGDDDANRDNDDDNGGNDDPTVTSVTVSPASVTVSRGQTETFTATVAGTGSPAQEVTWTVEGVGFGTTITNGGVLTVGADESASSLTVRATSTVDTGKIGTAAVTVTAAGVVPKVTSVTVSPGSVTVSRGQTQTFTATVAGTGSPAQEVTWTVEGEGFGTTITNGGVLTVGADESASSLTVRATSTYDTGKSGTAAVTVIVIVIEEGVALIYPEDIAAGAFPEGIILFKIGTEDKRTKTLTVSGDYDTYQWRVDGTVKENSETIVLDAAEYTLGTHQISVEVTRGGEPYSKSGSFTVDYEQPVALVDFLRLKPQKIPDLWAAFGVCRVKNRLIGDFLGFYARSATNS
jgi:hypothetical protein